MIQYPEAAVVEPLLECSECFRRFYERERARISLPIDWVQDSTLPPGVDYRTTRLDTGERLICLRRIPPETTDDLNVAHELVHLLVDLEGFPATGAREEFHNLSSAVNSMVHDPLVCHILLPYGFNLEMDLERQLEESRTQLATHRTPPANRLGQLHWAVNYVGNILESDAIGDSAADSVRVFREWFDATYPSVLPIVTEVRRLVRRTGYSTPREMRLLFQRFIHKFHLKKHLKICVPNTLLQRTLTPAGFGPLNSNR